MMRSRTFRLLQSGACVVCTIPVWRYSARFEGTEFNGGQITGPLLQAADISILLFVLGLILTFFALRLSAFVTVSASLLALPLFLYATCPGPFRYIFKGSYSAPAPHAFVLDSPSLIGMTAIALALLVSISNMFAPQPRVKSSADI